MGTNFYLKESKCKHCGREEDRGKHIGKSSAGWVFALHVYPDEGIRDLDDWLRLFYEKEIVDEYGKQLTASEMIHWIIDRNPNMLSAEGEYHGISKGFGNWDLHTGDFS